MPDVNYKPYKPNPRTTRSLLRRSYAIAPPAAPAPVPMPPVMPSPLNPLGGTGDLPGFALGGVVRFAGGGEVDSGGGDWWNQAFNPSPLDDYLSADDERRKQDAQAQAAQQVAQQPPAPAPNAAPNLLQIAAQQAQAQAYAQQAEDQNRAAAQQAQQQQDAQQAGPWQNMLQNTNQMAQIPQALADYNAGPWQNMLQNTNAIAQMAPQPQPQGFLDRLPGPLGAAADVARSVPVLGSGLNQLNALDQLRQAPGSILEKTLGGLGNYIGSTPIPGVGPGFSALSGGLNKLGLGGPLHNADLGTVGGQLTAQNQGQAGIQTGLEQIPGFTSLPGAVQTGLGAVPLAALPGGDLSLAQRGALAFGSGALGYGAQKGAAVLGAGPNTQQAAGLIATIGSFEAGRGALESPAGQRMAGNIAGAVTDLHDRLNPVLTNLNSESGMVRLGANNGAQRVDVGQVPHPSELAGPEDIHTPEEHDLHLAQEAKPPVETSGQEYVSGPRTAFSGQGGGAWGGLQPRPLEGPAEPANLRLPGGEPIYAPPGETPLRPGLPGPGQTASDVGALDRGVADFRGTPQTQAGDLRAPPAPPGQLPPGPEAPLALPERAQTPLSQPQVPTSQYQGPGGIGTPDVLARPNPLVEGRIDQMWQRLQEGDKLPFADRPGTMEARVQQAADAGLIRSRDDLAQVVRPAGGAADPTAWVTNPGAPVPQRSVADLINDRFQMQRQAGEGLNPERTQVKDMPPQQVIDLARSLDVPLDPNHVRNAGPALRDEINAKVQSALDGSIGRAEDANFQAWAKDRVAQEAAKAAQQDKNWMNQPGGKPGARPADAQGGGLGRVSGGPGRGSGRNGAGGQGPERRMRQYQEAVDNVRQDMTDGKLSINEAQDRIDALDSRFFGNNRGGQGANTGGGGRRSGGAGGTSGGGRGGAQGAGRGVNWNAFHNLFGGIGSFTQPLVTGDHLMRFLPQQLFRPGVAINGLKALGEGFAKGEAKEMTRHVNEDIGPAIPQGRRASDMREMDGGPRQVNRTAVQWAIDHSPVGPVLTRFRQANSAMLSVMRDAQYNYAADRVARTNPNATLAEYRDLWQRANTATGHTTIPIFKNSASANMGVGLGAFGARLQETAGLVLGHNSSRAESFKTMLGLTTAMASSSVLAKALGASVNVKDPFNTYGLDSTWLRPVTHNDVFRTVYGTGGAGYDTIIRGAMNVGHDIAEGDWEKAAKDLGRFGRGEFGVLPGAVIDGILKENYRGEKYTWTDFLNEFKTGFQADPEGKFGEGRGTPIPAKGELDAYKAYGPEGLLRGAPALAASEATTTPLTRSAMNQNAMEQPDRLAQAFPGDPEQARRVGGDEYGNITTREKQALNNAMTPEQKASLDAQAQHLRNVEDPYQAAIDQRNNIRNSYNPTFDELSRMLDKPHADASSINAARNQLYDEMNKAMAAVKFPTSDAQGREPSTIQKLVEGYNGFYNIKDATARQSAQQQYLLDTEKQFGNDMAKRLSANIAPQVNEQAHPLIQAYQKAAPLVQPYFSIPVVDRNGKLNYDQLDKRTDYMVKNPSTNVTAAYLYGSSLYSAEAARQYQSQHPGADRNVSINMGEYQPSTSYRRLPQTSDLVTYEALPQDKRADYLRGNPALNALLYQTGHTVMIYSLQAYDRLNRR